MWTNTEAASSSKKMGLETSDSDTDVKRFEFLEVQVSWKV